MIDLAKLKLTNEEIAAALGINYVSLWRRITGRVSWKRLEIEKLEKLAEEQKNENQNIAVADPEIPPLS